MKHLKAFVHVSTAFCNHRNGSLDDIKAKIIREELYPDVDDYEKIIRIAEETDEWTLNSLTKVYERTDIFLIFFIKFIF